MRQDVIARQVRAMKVAGLDAVISVSPENFAYVTGFLSPTQPLMRWRHAMGLVTAAGVVALVVVDMEASTIRTKSPPGTEIAVWREFEFDAMEVLAALLRKHGLADSRIGVELDYLPAGDLAALSKLLPPGPFCARYRPCLRACARSRHRRRSIFCERACPRIADRAITEAYRTVHVGSSEMDRAAALTRGIYEQGAEYFKLMIVATGERSVFPNVRPNRPRAQTWRCVPRRIFPDHRWLSRRRLPHRRGGRAAAPCRTHLGEPDGVQVSATGCHQTGARRAARFTSSILPKSASSACRRFPSSATASACTCTRIPTSVSTADRTLEPGMVLGIEPLIYETGFGFGMQTKDMVWSRLMAASCCRTISILTSSSSSGKPRSRLLDV